MNREQKLKESELNMDSFKKMCNSVEHESIRLYPRTHIFRNTEKLEFEVLMDTFKIYDQFLRSMCQVHAHIFTDYKKEPGAQIVHCYLECRGHVNFTALFDITNQKEAVTFAVRLIGKMLNAQYENLKLLTKSLSSVKEEKHDEDDDRHPYYTRSSEPDEDQETSYYLKYVGTKDIEEMLYSGKYAKFNKELKDFAVGRINGFLGHYIYDSINVKEIALTRLRDFAKEYLAGVVGEKASHYMYAVNKVLEPENWQVSTTK